MQFPHCDSRILHAPFDDCKYCNDRPEWQNLRKAWGIAFTGHDPEKGQMPCPADAARPAGAENDHRRWRGNVATSAEPVKETFASNVFYNTVLVEEKDRSDWWSSYIRHKKQRHDKKKNR